MSTIIRTNPPPLPDLGQNGFSQIAIAETGRIAHISGQVAWTPEGMPVPAVGVAIP